MNLNEKSAGGSGTTRSDSPLIWILIVALLVTFPPGGLVLLHWQLSRRYITAWLPFLLAAVVLFLIFLFGEIAQIDDYLARQYNPAEFVSVSLAGLVYFGASAVVLATISLMIRGKVRRYKTYTSLIHSGKIDDLSTLAEVTGRDSEEVLRDLQAMIGHGRLEDVAVDEESHIITYRTAETSAQPDLPITVARSTSSPAVPAMSPTEPTMSPAVSTTSVPPAMPAGQDVSAAPATAAAQEMAVFPAMPPEAQVVETPVPETATAIPSMDSVTSEVSTDAAIETATEEVTAPEIHVAEQIELPAVTMPDARRRREERKARKKEKEREQARAKKEKRTASRRQKQAGVSAETVVLDEGKKEALSEQTEHRTETPAFASPENSVPAQTQTDVRATANGVIIEEGPNTGGGEISPVPEVSSAPTVSAVAPIVKPVATGAPRKKIKVYAGTVIPVNAGEHPERVTPLGRARPIVVEEAAESGQPAGGGQRLQDSETSGMEDFGIQRAVSSGWPSPQDIFGEISAAGENPDGDGLYAGPDIDPNAVPIWAAREEFP